MDSRFAPLAAGRRNPGPGAAAAEGSPGARVRAARPRFALSDLSRCKGSAEFPSPGSERGGGFLWASFLSAGGSEACEGAALCAPLPPHPSPFPRHIQWGRKVAAGAALSPRSRGGAAVPLCLPLSQRPARTGTGRASSPKPPGHRDRAREEGEEQPSGP